MIEQERETERHRKEVQIIKRTIGPDHKGRGVYLPGLLACRLATGYSQRDLAERARVARGTVRSLERGERRAHAATTQRLSAALAVSLADLITAEAIEKN